MAQVNLTKEKNFHNMKKSSKKRLNMENTITPLNVEIGKRLRKERERLNLNKENISTMAQVTPRTVSDWEKGKTFPHLLQLIRLAENGISLSAIFQEYFSNQTIDKLVVQDYDLEKGGAISDAAKNISLIFFKNPSWKLINLETKYGKKGEEIGLRFFFTYPVPILRDEAQVVYDQYIDDIIESFKELPNKNKF